MTGHQRGRFVEAVVHVPADGVYAPAEDARIDQQDHTLALRNPEWCPETLAITAGMLSGDDPCGVGGGGRAARYDLLHVSRGKRHGPAQHT